MDERFKGLDQEIVKDIQSNILESNLKTTWNDIAGLDFAKQMIFETLILPRQNPDLFKGLAAPPKGMLMFGPQIIIINSPGTGKTMIGKAIASESESTFFSISASTLTSKWIGEGEKRVKTLFQIAQILQPSVIFIDEIDSLLTSRSDNENEASRRIKTEFLVQLDGCNSSSEGVLFIGATNRPQELDDAIRRRFVKKLYIPLPNLEGRYQLFKNIIQNEIEIGKKFLIDEIIIGKVAQSTKGFSGADIRNLCQVTTMQPIRKLFKDGKNFKNIHGLSAENLDPIDENDFQQALKEVKASVSPSDLFQYQKWNSEFGSEQIDFDLFDT